MKFLSALCLLICPLNAAVTYTFTETASGDVMVVGAGDFVRGTGTPTANGIAFPSGQLNTSSAGGGSFAAAFGGFSADELIVGIVGAGDPFGNFSFSEPTFFPAGSGSLFWTGSSLYVAPGTTAVAYNATLTGTTLSDLGLTNGDTRVTTFTFNDATTETVTLQAVGVPEPSSVMLLGLGTASLLRRRRA